jgi:hypothetical protein
LGGERADFKKKTIIARTAGPIKFTGRKMFSWKTQGLLMKSARGMQNLFAKLFEQISPLKRIGLANKCPSSQNRYY